MRFDPQVLIDSWPLLLDGFLLTIRICAFAVLLGFAIAIPLALVKLSRSPLLRGAASAVIELLRNVPFLILLFLVHYGLPFTGVRLPAVVTGTVALALFGAAYYAEVIRAAILAVPRGQMESARAIGMSWLRAMREIVAPQTLRFLVPPATNTTLTLIKESSVLSIITVPEVTYAALRVQGQSFSPIEVFVATALAYWGLTALVAAAAGLLERRVGTGQRTAVTRNALAARYLSLERSRP
jgi:polar amino acid transport system permease protein